MNFSFENQGTHTYLVYTVGEDDVIDSMSLGMITNNRIHGLAHTLFAQMDTTKFFKYDVSAKISVKQFFTGPVNKKRLIGVFNGIVDAMMSAEEYMIDVNSILMDLDHIYADVSTCETVLICLPVVSDDLSVRDLGAFFKNIMFTTQFDQTENCDHVAKIMNYLNSAPVFSLADFKALLESIDVSSPVRAQQQVLQTVPPQPSAQPKVVSTPATPAQTQIPVQQISVEPKHIQQNAVQQPPIPRPADARVNGASVPPVAPNPITPSGAPAQKMPEAPAKKKGLFGGLFSSNNKKPAKEEKKKPAPAVKGAIPPSNQSSFAIPGQQTPVQPKPVQPPVQQKPAQAQAPVQPKPVQPKPAQQAPAQPPVQRPAQQTQQRPVAPAPAQQQVPPVYTPAQMPQGQPMNFGETTVLGGASNAGETTVLGASPAAQVIPHLIRTKNNEKIDLNKPVYRIGKERSYVDYFVGDNSAISRSHANIISRDGQYFVVDTNSTNHTYVNGQMLQSNVETKIAHGDKIRLANEEFTFKLY